MITMSRVWADGRPDRPRIGDRVTYDPKSGCLHVLRGHAPLQVNLSGQPHPSNRLFVGEEWSVALTRAAAELYARLGHLDAGVARVDEGFASRITFELVVVH